VIENCLGIKDDYEYVQIQSDPEVDEFVNGPEYLPLPNKYKYQMISDLVRYKYMMDHPDSIYIDTDFCLFDETSLKVLVWYHNRALKLGIDMLAGEMNKNRLFPCNWLMIGGNVKDGGIFKKMYELLKSRMTNSCYELYQVPKDTKWAGKLEDYIWTVLWGYAIPRDMPTKEYGLLPYSNFQSCEWNKDWRDDSILRRDQLVACHFFGFGEGGRPSLNEFLEYHKLGNDSSKRLIFYE
jgi:hypothetical protein